MGRIGCQYQRLYRDMLVQGSLTEVRGRLSTVDLLVLSAVFDIVNIIYFLTKQATLMRRSTVLSFPLSVSVPWLLIFAYFFVWVAR
jgi:hypothetical protein